MRPTRWGGLSAVLGLAYVVGCAVAGWSIPADGRTDFDVAVWPAVQQVLHGHPLHVYEPAKTIVHAASPPRVALDHGPISLVPMSVAGYALTLAGHADDIRLQRAAALAVTALFSLLMAREAVRVLEDARGEQLTRPRRLALSAALLCIPALGFGIYTHVELPIGLWLFLRSLRDVTAGRMVRSALMAGASVLSRTTVVLLVIPMAVSVFRQRGPRVGGRWCATAAATVALVMTPFVLADPTAVRAAFLEVRAAQLVSYGSLAVLAAGTPLEPFIQRADTALMGVGVLVFLWLVRRSVADVRLGAPGALGIFAGTSLWLPLLAKASFAYYAFEPTVLAILWWLSLRGSSGSIRPGSAALLLTGAAVADYVAVFAGPRADTRLLTSVVAGGLISYALLEIVRGLRSDQTLARPADA